MVRKQPASDYLIKHVEDICGKGSMESPTIIHEDYVACVAQMQRGYIKSNITKRIAPKLFYPRELQNIGGNKHFASQIM
jgi:hypothetical protein